MIPRYCGSLVYMYPFFIFSSLVPTIIAIMVIGEFEPFCFSGLPSSEVLLIIFRR
jgi:hypothetical protein